MNQLFDDTIIFVKLKQIEENQLISSVYIFNLTIIRRSFFLIEVFEAISTTAEASSALRL